METNWKNIDTGHNHVVNLWSNGKLIATDKTNSTRLNAEKTANDLVEYYTNRGVDITSVIIYMESDKRKS